MCVVGGWVGGVVDRGEMRWGWRRAADPLHPAEAAVHAGPTLPKHTHTLNKKQKCCSSPPAHS